MSFLKKFASNKLGVLEYKGTWDASSNTPELASSLGKSGNYYIVSVAGSTELNGESVWEIGDWVIFSGSQWQRLNTADDTIQNSEKGIANGVAQLDANSKVPAIQLPISNEPITSSTTTIPTEKAVFDAINQVDEHIGLVEGLVGTLEENTINTFSAVYEQINTRVPLIQKGAVNGVATLDTNGKVPLAQLPSFPAAPVTSVNGMTGDVVIATGDAAIQDSISDGVTNIAPSQNAVYDALALKANDSAVVKEVNGQSPTAGAVSINTDNVAEGSTNLYFTSTRAKDATVLDDISGNETDIAPSINSIKNYVDNSITGIGFGKRYNYYTSAEQSSTSTTYASVTDLTSTSLPVGLYKFKFWGLMQSNSATNGVGVRINGTDAGISTCFAFWNISQASDGTNSTFSYDQTALTTNVVSQSVPAANTNLLVVGDGIFRVTSSGSISIQIRSEGSGHTVKIMPDSVFSIDLIS